MRGIAQPGQPSRSLIRSPGQQGVKRRQLIRANAIGQDFIGKSLGLLACVSDDHLDNSRGRQQHPSSSQLVDHRAGKRQRLGDGLRNRHRERHDRAKLVPVESGMTEPLHEIGEMRASGFIATGVIIERRRRHVDLVGDEGDNGTRRFLARLQHTARPTYIKQQHREPEAARRSTTFADKIEILAAGVVTAKLCDMAI